MNNKELAKELKTRFPPNVVQFHLIEEDIEIRPTLKEEIILHFSDEKITLQTHEKEELASFTVDTDISTIEKHVRAYILS